MLCATLDLTLMKRLIFSLVLITLPHAAVAATNKLPNAAAIVRSIDSIRRPQKSYVVDLSITEIQGRTRMGEARLRMYARQQGPGGKFDFLFQLLEPPQDRGKIILKKGRDLWLYDPRSARPVRMSAQHAVLGRGWIIDVLTARFQEEYEAQVEGQELVFDAAHHPRLSIRVKLTAKPGVPTSASTVYYWVDYWNRRPILGKFYPPSGRLLRASYYTDYKKVLGESRPTQVVVALGMDTHMVFALHFSRFSYRDFPEEWFQVGYLPRVVRLLDPPRVR